MGPRGDDSRLNACLNMLCVYGCTVVKGSTYVLELLTFCGNVRVATEGKGVICLAITFRHSAVTRVDLLKKEM